MINKYEQTYEFINSVDEDGLPITGTYECAYQCFKNGRKDVILEALRAMKLVADGTHVIVPVEPTQEMIKAFEAVPIGLQHIDGYKAMIKSYTHKEE